MISEFEAFPREEPENKVRISPDGTILYDSYDELKSYPFHVQIKALNQNRIKLFSRPADDIKSMASFLGGIDEVGEFLYKRDVDDFMNRSRVTNKK